MRAIDANFPCEADALCLTDVAVPELKPGQVLVRTVCAGVNRPDILQRRAMYPPPASASLILGLEVAGEVVEIGEGVTQWQVGDRLCGLCHGGGYAEFVAIDARHCLPLPDAPLPDDPFALGATAIEVSFTVWHNLFRIAGLHAGERVLIHGGASGIGTCAIQLAKAVGATVITTVGSTEKAEYCAELGADLVCLYPENSWGADIRREFGNVDVILDMVGGDFIQPNIDLLAEHGRYSIIAFLRGPKAKLDLSSVLRRQLKIQASTMRNQTVESKAQIAQEVHEFVWPLFQTKAIRLPLAGRFALEDAGAAHTLLEEGLAMGKVVLDVAPAS